MRISLLARLVLAAIKAYKWLISPLFTGSCRYLPSCSDYTALAVHRHGALVGMALGAGRICRCQPFGGSGFDPVPEQLRAPKALRALKQLLVAKQLPELFQFAPAVMRSFSKQLPELFRRRMRAEGANPVEIQRNPAELELVQQDRPSAAETTPGVVSNCACICAARRETTPGVVSVSYR